MPTCVATVLFRTLVAPPDSALVDCCVCDCLDRIEMKLGAQKRFGLRDADVLDLRVIRCMRMWRFCSSARATASSIDRRRTTPVASG
jgi:hypothetical protein